MDGGEVLIPITVFLMVGIVLVSWIYYRSKEKQMMIDKGMSYEQMVELLKIDKGMSYQQMVEFLKTKRNPYTILKIGIVIAVSGIGIGIGSYIGENYQHEGMGGIAALFIIVFIGLGFITAFYATKKYEVDNNLEYNKKEKVGE